MDIILYTRIKSDHERIICNRDTSANGALIKFDSAEVENLSKYGNTHSESPSAMPIICSLPFDALKLQFSQEFNIYSSLFANY